MRVEDINNHKKMWYWLSEKIAKLCGEKKKWNKESQFVLEPNQ